MFFLIHMPNIYVFKNYLLERQRRETASTFLVVDSLLRWPQHWSSSRLTSGDCSFTRGSRRSGRDPRAWATFSCLPRHTGRELGQQRGSCDARDATAAGTGLLHCATSQPQGTLHTVFLNYKSAFVNLLFLRKTESQIAWFCFVILLQICIQCLLQFLYSGQTFS